MRKYITAAIVSILSISPALANTAEKCQQTMIVQQITESSLKNWQAWKQQSAIKTNLKNNDSTYITISNS